MFWSCGSCFRVVPSWKEGPPCLQQSGQPLEEMGPWQGTSSLVNMSLERADSWVASPRRAHPETCWHGGSFSFSQGDLAELGNIPAATFPKEMVKPGNMMKLLWVIVTYFSFTQGRRYCSKQWDLKNFSLWPVLWFQVAFYKVLFHCCIYIFKDLFVLLEGRVTDRRRSSIHCWLPKWLQRPELNWSKAEIRKSPKWMQRPNDLGHHSLPSQAIIQEIDQKWSSWDLNSCP